MFRKRSGDTRNDFAGLIKYEKVYTVPHNTWYESNGVD